MFVVDEGPPDAPVVLLLHGFSSSSHSWDLVTPLLTDRFRVVRVDLLGHGRTGGAAADAPAQADAVGAVLRDRGLADVTVVGHSFGADVAVELAERGGPATRLVVLAQAPDYAQAVLPRAGVLMTRTWSPALYRAVRRLFVTPSLRDLRALDPAMFRVVLVDRRARMERRPLDAQVAAAGVPTLVVLADLDHFYGDRSAGRYRAAGARVEVVVGGGHDLPHTRPRETAAAVAGFVDAADLRPDPGR